MRVLLELSQAWYNRRLNGQGAPAARSGCARTDNAKVTPATEALRNRLSRLSEASLRITESLDLDNILQGVIDGARSLTGARYGALLILDDAGGLQDLVISGMTPAERRKLGALPRGLGLLGYLSEIEGPLRLAAIAGHPSSVGFPEGHPPMKTFLGAPVRHRGERLGNIYLTEKEGGAEFTSEDEEILVMFASQAALTVSNAHRFRDEQQARADLEALVNTSPVGIVIFDAKTGDLVSLNQETRRIIRGVHAPGHTLPELLSVMTFRRLDGREIPPDELPTVRAIRTGETVRAEEIVIHLPDGHAVTTVINATPVRSAAGEIVSVIATIQDMTPLEELERLRAEFLGMVSHELRMPLTAIKGSAATALNSTSSVNPAEAYQFFRIIDEQADRMRSLINDLLDVTRVEAGMLSITPEASSVASLVDQATAAFLGGGAGNRVEVALPPDLPPVAADRQRVVQVLGNLLANASKYSPASSPITVTAARQDSHVAVSVTDEGRGVSAEELPQLFRKFLRIRSADGETDVGGEGLGLAIAKGIVEAHGGRIWAESDGPGRGTRFTFTFPVAGEDGTDAADGPDEPAALPREAARHGTRVLAVDDDPQTLFYVRHTLSEAGYTTIVTGDPDDVDRLIEVEKPHLILLDLELPGTNGFELMKRIPDMTDAPVLFLSGHGADQDISRGLAIGAADYIVKPFSPIELVARINAALRKGAASGRTEQREPYVLGDLTINYAERFVTVAGRSVHLTATEYNLLVELSVNAGRVLTHNQLLSKVWGPDYLEASQLLRTYVAYLRSKLGDAAKDPTYIFTEPRVGYRMARPD